MRKVEIRQKCKICGGKVSGRFRTYCSKKCRQKAHYIKWFDYNKEWQRKRRDEKAVIASKDKMKCKICGKWYVQLGTHIVQIHKLTAREYREQYDYPVKRGVVPKWYRQKKGEMALENKTYKNLKKGKKHWYKKGDKRAKETTYWKGKIGKGRENIAKDIYGE